MVFKSISLPLTPNIEKDISNIPIHELILPNIYRINHELKSESINCYVVYISFRDINIRIVKQERPSLVRNVYFIKERDLQTMIVKGNAFLILYNQTLFVKECFSFEWHKDVGLFTLKKGVKNYFPNYGKTLTETLIYNHRRIWRVR